MLEVIRNSYILTYFGVFSTLIFVCLLLLRLFNLLRIHLPNCTWNLRSCTQWAIITAGSSVIGKGYAHQPANFGLDIVIISKELEDLKDTVEEIKSKYGVRCCYTHVDFTEENVFEFLNNSLYGVEIDILVNCADIEGEIPSQFLQESDESVYRSIDLRVRAVTHMTRLTVPFMLARQKGIIINIASIFSAHPCPFLNVYSSCNAFSDRLFRSLSYEYKSQNVNFQSVIPLNVCNKMEEKIVQDLPVLKFFILDRDRLVKNVLSTIGLTDYTTGYWLSDVLWHFYLIILFKWYLFKSESKLQDNKYR
ncbi:very-long-chain 3-oxoacyl-CoA reductase-like [Centruroides sculpturatus]|uniref:very-long-chain 3-oxoacyl-CoA reductase-like n=1 Tax=Centruroides sculpturatus TaxID=218467 RepID=UPI000C6E0B01|nr:very-long-chain 3-oxoacyl-CoA reductase-like [Centruroides sculpturatus]